MEALWKRYGSVSPHDPPISHLQPEAELLVPGEPVKPPCGMFVEVGASATHLVLIERQRRRSVTRRAAPRAEREALDRRRAGAICCRVCAGARAYFGPRPGWLLAGDMMVDWVIPLGQGVAAARSF
jgi:hypothetical protein